MYDSYGDGWGDSMYTWTSPWGTEESGSLTYEEGAEGTVTLKGCDCYDFEVDVGDNTASEISWQITNDATGDVEASGVAGDSAKICGKGRADVCSR